MSLQKEWQNCKERVYLALFHHDGHLIHPKCQYIRGTTALDSFIEDLKPELNLRLEKPDEQHEQLFIIISEFNAFFDMITNEQAAFMRKVFQYIDSPQYNICFVCGFDVNGEKNELSYINTVP